MIRIYTYAIHIIISSLLFISPCSAQDSVKPWTAPADLIEDYKTNQRWQTLVYEESNVPKYTLPDPLVANDGSPVTTKEQWDLKRRGELMELFRSQVYGKKPDVEYSVQYEITGEIKDAIDGKATGRSIKATVSIGDRTFSFPFVLFIPNKTQKPVPAVIHINNRYFIPLEKAESEYDPFWSVKTLIERGYATASFHTSDVDPDRKDGYTEGIRSFFADGKPPKDDAWRSLSAWGWAASKILDHLETVDRIDGQRVAIVGHSRGGKTALWAACEDTRFAVAYSNNSGCGGAALSRRTFGETVGIITSAFPHWFCKPFASYADRESELPVDQHEVISLIAPRGVYAASADRDLWADPRGEYLSVIESAPVFKLLGKESITNREMPPLNQPRIKGSTGYHIRTGKHNLTEQDWGYFLDFADTRLKI